MIKVNHIQPNHTQQLLTPGPTQKIINKKNILFQIGFPFAKLLRNFCGTKRNIFLSLRINFARKNNNLRNHSQKSFRLTNELIDENKLSTAELFSSVF